MNPQKYILLLQFATSIVATSGTKCYCERSFPLIRKPQGTFMFPMEFVNGTCLEVVPPPPEKDIRGMLFESSNVNFRVDNAISARASGKTGLYEGDLTGSERSTKCLILLFKRCDIWAEKLETNCRENVSQLQSEIIHRKTMVCLEKLTVAYSSAKFQYKQIDQFEGYLKNCSNAFGPNVSEHTSTVAQKTTSAIAHTGADHSSSVTTTSASPPLQLQYVRYVVTGVICFVIAFIGGAIG